MRLENAGRTLQVALLAFVGLLFYVAVLLVIGFAGELLLSAYAHAQTAPASGSWTATGNLTTARAGHTATLLRNGKVLVAGGIASDTSPVLDSAELYDPATGAWSATGHLAYSHSGHTATLLKDGRVLVVSGGAAELYDPASGNWSLTGTPITRDFHAAVLLQDGKVLVAGGFGAFDVLDSAELYDPATGSWTSTGSLLTARYSHTMTLLQDGTVLAAGGTIDGDFSMQIDDCELYDPATGTWTRTASLRHVRAHHTATLLASGKVLVAGGYFGDYPGGFARATSLDEAEVFDPMVHFWGATDSLRFARESHAATLLSDGRVLVTGGLAWSGTYPNIIASLVSSTELYDSQHAIWSSTGGLGVARHAHTATLLADGRVLVAGGYTSGIGASVSSSSAEIYTPTVQIDSTLTGSWYDPNQSGQGLMLEVLPGNGLLALWFSFDPAGKQAWFGGVGSYSGNTATISAVALPSGAKWIPNFDEKAIVQNPWGTLVFTFTDHDHGKVDFTSSLGFGSGSMSLTRLTSIAPPQSPPQAVASPVGPPVGVVADAAGNFYFSSSPDQIFKVASNGSLTHLAGTGTPGYSGDGGPGTQAQLNFPLSYPELQHDPVDFAPLVGGLVLDAANNLYIADAYNNRVRRIDASGIITTVAGNGSRGNAGDGGLATLGEIYWPQGVGLDPAGNLYITSAYGPLFKVTLDGVLHTMAAANCGAGYLGPGLCAPEEIAVDASGNVFVPDGYCRVREVRPGGSVVTVAGADTVPSNGFSFTCGYSGDGGAATKAALAFPYGVAVDKDGNLYIADSGNSCIRKVNAAGSITTFAGICSNNPHPGYYGDGGPATKASLNGPYGVAVDGAGNLFIADTANNRVRKVSQDGIITTVAGNGGIDALSPGTIGPAITGNWYDPSQSGQGLMLEVLSGNRILALWFSFTPDGNQAWFGGLGTYSGNTATITTAALPTGGKWIPNFDPNAVVKNPWGTLAFTFTDCNHGKVAFSSSYDGYGSGSMNLTRLTLPLGLACP